VQRPGRAGQHPNQRIRRTDGLQLASSGLWSGAAAWRGGRGVRSAARLAAAAVRNAQTSLLD